MSAITTVDLQALSEADLVVVGSWTDGFFVFGQRPGRAGRLKERLPAMRGKKAATFVTFTLEPRKALDKLSDLVRATGADVIGGMAIRQATTSRVAPGNSPTACSRRPTRRADGRRRPAVRCRRRCPSG